MRGEGRGDWVKRDGIRDKAYRSRVASFSLIFSRLKGKGGLRGYREVREKEGEGLKSIAYRTVVDLPRMTSFSFNGLRENVEGKEKGLKGYQ